MAEIWNVPGVYRPNFASRMVRGVVVLGLGGTGLVATSVLASVSTFTGELTPGRVAAGAASAALNVALFVAAFRITTVRTIPTRQLLPGAVIGGVAWTLLQALGGYFVGHQLRNASEVYGFFATVLGLLSWIFSALALRSTRPKRTSSSTGGCGPAALCNRRSLRPTSRPCRTSFARKNAAPRSRSTCPSTTPPTSQRFALKRLARIEHRR
jgi:Virulence factor BrkB